MYGIINNNTGGHTMKTIYQFSDDLNFGIEVVGGKGFSLVKMSQAGLPVPPGFILTINFFQPWVDAIAGTTEWKEFIAAGSEEREKYTKALQKICEDLRFTTEQQADLDNALKEYDDPEEMLFAIRSSSPEEDLEKASFAGIYETEIGVKVSGIEKAVSKVFASALDIRAITYKELHGFDIGTISIAIVVQQQIASEVAGVGFTINPLNNCYYEAVINANWGLGESIVSGAATPDQFVIKRNTGEIIDHKMGGKELSYILQDDSSIATRTDLPHEVFCLGDDKVIELTNLLQKVEDYYGMPMDTEWAYAEEMLYLLQARPITTYLPLPPEMVSAPGDPRRLYLDLTLIEQGIQSPLSPMGAEWFGETSRMMMKKATGKDIGRDLINGFSGAEGGRVYINLSNMLWIMGPDSIAAQFEGLDTTSGDIIRRIDPKLYKSPNKPEGYMGMIAGGIFHSAGLVCKTLVGLVVPEHLEKVYHKGVSEYLEKLEAEDSREQSLLEYYNAVSGHAIDLMLKTTIPTLIDSELAKSSLRKMFAKDKDEIRKKADMLDRALPHNVTTEMGLKIYQLSRLLDPTEFDSLETLAEKIRDKTVSPEFMDSWDAFMEHFGFRGPREIDLASLRYSEDPVLLLSQVQNFVRIDDDAQNPLALFKTQQAEREVAARELEKYLKEHHRMRLHRFRRMYHILKMFGGYREIHKYYLVMASAGIRRRIIEAGRKLASDGRLDHLEDVFALTIHELNEALEGGNSNLREIMEKNLSFIRKIDKVSSFPPIVDSWGTILRPPRKESEPGIIYGDAVSAGIVQGPVKILHTASEKPINPGDILVIHAADPGWTPLFITAGGVILEVGGMLQHGSIIAREYGKPCIAGVEDILEKFRDGQMVELNGAEGSIRFLDGE